LFRSREYVIPVLVVAVAVYTSVPAPWHLVDVAPKLNTGVPTDAVMVTVCVAVFGPLHPAALAVIVDVPLHVPAYVTSPVEELIVLPADKLDASSEYVMPVVFVAVAP